VEPTAKLNPLIYLAQPDSQVVQSRHEQDEPLHLCRPLIYGYNRRDLEAMVELPSSCARGCGETGTEHCLGVDETMDRASEGVGEHRDSVRVAEADEAGIEPEPAD
jgi:hypothetical protein